MAVLYSLFGPFLIWPVEHFLPYPYIIEELFKALVVFFVHERSAKIFIMAGVVFALTETYSLNINAFGHLSLIFVRLITSSILHSLTFLIIYWSSIKSKKLIPLGFALSVLIHFVYNYSLVPNP